MAYGGKQVFFPMPLGEIVLSHCVRNEDCQFLQLQFLQLALSDNLSSQVDKDMSLFSPLQFKEKRKGEPGRKSTEIVQAMSA